VKADAPLAGSTGIIVLHTKAGEDFHAAIVKAHWNAESVFPQWPAQHLAHMRGKVQFWATPSNCLCANSNSFIV